MIKKIFCLILLVTTLFIFSCGPSIEVTLPVKMEKVHIDSEEGIVSFKYKIDGTIFIDNVDDLEETQIQVLFNAKDDLENADFSVKIKSIPGGISYITYYCGPVELGLSGKALSREKAIKLFSENNDQSKKEMIKLDGSNEQKPQMKETL